MASLATLDHSLHVSSSRQASTNRRRWEVPRLAISFSMILFPTLCTVGCSKFTKPSTNSRKVSTRLLNFFRSWTTQKTLCVVGTRLLFVAMRLHSRVYDRRNIVKLVGLTSSRDRVAGDKSKILRMLHRSRSCCD